MSNRSFLIVITACLAFTVALHAKPPSPPATPPAHPPIPKDETPRQALLRGMKVYDSGDIEAAMELFHFVGDEEKKMARLEGESSIAIAHLEKVVKAKFGKDVSDAVVHALDEETAADVGAAEINVDGDHASVHCKGNNEPDFTMIRTGGVWKFDMHALFTSMSADERKDMIHSCTKIRDGLPKIAHDVSAGKIKKAEKVVEKVDKFAESLDKPEPAKK
jgi:hypothetical protein